VTAASAEAQAPIVSAGEAESTIANLHKIMDRLMQTVEEETARVRSGELRATAELDEAKVELARLYAAETDRVKSAKAIIVQSLPEALEALRQRHDSFHALLQTNLTVLATAHAVSEGIIRGVSGELARKHTPTTYGATGRATAPGIKNNQPLAISRKL
jgi:flagellar biosynthesis/type III secretory pathway chaperone